MKKIGTIKPALSILVSAIILYLVFNYFNVTSVVSANDQVAIVIIAAVLIILPSQIFGSNTITIDDDRMVKIGRFKYIITEALLLFFVAAFYFLYKNILLEELMYKSGVYSYMGMVILIAFWIFVAFSIVRFTFSIINAFSKNK